MAKNLKTLTTTLGITVADDQNSECRQECEVNNINCYLPERGGLGNIDQRWP